MLSVWRKGIKEAIFTFAKKTEKKLPHQRHCHRTSCRSEFVTRWHSLFFFMHFFCIAKILQKFSKNLVEKIAQNRWKLKRSCCIKGIVIQHLTHQSLWQDGNFDFLFSSSSSSYSWNFVSKSSSNEFWIIKYQVLSGS